MAKSYSKDLRERVVEAVEREGMSRRGAAARFGVGIKTAIDWVRQYRETGRLSALRRGGRRPKKLVGAHRDWLLQRCREGEFTLRGLVAELGRLSGCLGVRPRREAQLQKKTLVAQERDRPDVARRRVQWRSRQKRVDPARLVFIDETWTTTNMSPLRGWGPRGKRLLAKVPHGRWKTLTFIAALRHDRVAAPWLIEGPINGESFRVYVEKVLAPTLAPDDIVVMDMCGRPRWCKKNLSKSTGRGQVLTCVRPLMRPSHAAGPYGSSRSGSNSISRARGTYP